MGVQSISQMVATQGSHCALPHNRKGYCQILKELTKRILRYQRNVLYRTGWLSRPFIKFTRAAQNFSESLKLRTLALSNKKYRIVVTVTENYSNYLQYYTCTCGHV
jgi:hypothetical protein